MISSFIDRHLFEARQRKAANIVEKHPDRVPVIVEKHPKARIAEIDKKKFIILADSTVAQFILEIGRHIKLEREEALFMFFGKRSDLPQQNALMSQVWATHKNDDGFLYVTYTGETSFGADRKVNETALLTIQS